MATYKVYAIRSLKNGRIYVGLSSDPDRRLEEHNKGYVFSTKGYRPWIMFYTEDCGVVRKDAREREKYLKTTSGKRFLKNICNS